MDPTPLIEGPVVFSADKYVKPFIDGNWLSIGILLYLLRSVAREFAIEPVRKVYACLAGAWKFVRPSSDVTPRNPGPK